VTNKLHQNPSFYVLVIAFFCWAGVWAFTSNSYNTKFQYWSFIDHDNLALQHILELPNESWDALEGNQYQLDALNKQFWRLDEHPILWLKIQIPRRIKESRLLLEIVPNTGVDGILVQNIDNRWQWISAEGRNPKRDQKLQTNYRKFPMDPRGEVKFAYLKINTSQVFNFSLNVFTENNWIWENLIRHLITGMVLGAMLLSLFYNLVIGISAGERIYIVFAAYVASTFLWTIVYMGYLRIVFPDWGGLGAVARSAVYVLMYTGIVLTRDFFNLRDSGKSLDRLLQFSQAGVVAALMVSLFINDFFAFVLNDTVSMYSITLILITSLIALKQGHPLARIFVLAWSIFLAAALAWALVWVGYVEPTLTSPHILLLGVSIKIALLSLVLSHRYTFLKETSEELNREFQKYQSLSERDELTGIYNRRGFLATVKNELETQPHELVWLSINIDNFKFFNDRYGHLTGDKILSEFGTLLKSRSQREEFTSKLIADKHNQIYRRSIVGRMSGEEFSVLLVNTSINQAKIYADRLLKEFSELKIMTSNGEFINTTLSIGGSVVSQTDNVDTAWKKADRNLSEAKNGGKSQIVIASS